MVKRSDITDQEFSFLVSQNILLSHLFDARGQAAASWRDAAKAEGMLFGLSEPCHAGHRLRKRVGHCIECDTAKIAYIRRHSDPDYVYIASSRSGSIHKFGCCSDVKRREAKLNYDGYAGCGDWVITAHCKTAKMGEIEFSIQKSLRQEAIERSYETDGKMQVAREVFGGDLTKVWKAYKAAITKISDALKWKHKAFASFDFSAAKNPKTV